MIVYIVVNPNGMGEGTIDEVHQSEAIAKERAKQINGFVVSRLICWVK